MTPLKDLRKVEFKTGDNRWIRCQMGQLEPGDIFRITDNDGVLVVWQGATEFRVKRPAAVDAEPANHPFVEQPPGKKLLPTDETLKV